MTEKVKKPRAARKPKAEPAAQPVVQPVAAQPPKEEPIISRSRARRQRHWGDDDGK